MRKDLGRRWLVNAHVNVLVLLSLYSICHKKERYDHGVTVYIGEYQPLEMSMGATHTPQTHI